MSISYPLYSFDCAEPGEGIGQDPRCRRESTDIKVPTLLTNKIGKCLKSPRIVEVWQYDPIDPQLHFNFNLSNLLHNQSQKGDEIQPEWYVSLLSMFNSHSA